MMTPDDLPPLTHLPNGWPLPPLFSEPEPPHTLKHCLICDALIWIEADDVCRQCRHEQVPYAWRWLPLLARYLRNLRGELGS